MRRVTFAGTRVGLAWSQETSGVIISDRLIAEIPHDSILTPDGALDPALASATAEGCRFVVKHEALCDHESLHALAQRAAQVQARCFSLSFDVPQADSVQLETLVEQVRTAHDILRLPVALDPRFSPTLPPAQSAQILREIVERSWSTYVLDLSSVAEHALAHHVDPDRMASDLPPDRVAYVRVRSSTTHPVSSTLKDLVLSTMARWEAHPPSIVLDSSRPISACMRELADLVAVSGHELTDVEWSHLDVAVQAATAQRVV